MTCCGDACLASASGPKVLRGRADGDELDIEALIDSVRRSALRLFATGTRLPGAPQTRPQSRCADPARRLRIRHRYRSRRPRRARSSATGGCHTGRHARRAWRPRRRLRISVRRADTLSICRRSRRSDNVSAPSAGPGSTSSNRRATPAWAPASAVRARYSRPRPAHQIGYWSSFRTAFPTTTATRAVMPKPTPEGPRRTSHGRRCLPVPFHRRRHCHRCARTRLRLRRLCQRRDPGRLEPADGRVVSVFPPGTRRTETTARMRHEGVVDRCDGQHRLFQPGGVARRRSRRRRLRPRLP